MGHGRTTSGCALVRAWVVGMGTGEGVLPDDETDDAEREREAVRDTLRGDAGWAVPHGEDGMAEIVGDDRSYAHVSSSTCSTRPLSNLATYTFLALSASTVSPAHVT